MSFDREAISNALYAVLTADGTFVAGGRRWKSYGDTTAFPALYLVDGDEEYQLRNVRGQPRVVDLDYEVWVYSNTSQLDRPVATDLNPLVQAVTGMFDPTPVVDVQTFGIPRVYDSWVSDKTKVIKDMAPLSGRGRAMIPIKIRVI